MIHTIITNTGVQSQKYLLTLQVSRYYRLALQKSIHMFHKHDLNIIIIVTYQYIHLFQSAEQF